MNNTGNSKKLFYVGNSFISFGEYSYGLENISVRQWGEGAALHIGKFCSIARSVTIFLGGNHRTDWITTFPFGHIYQDELGDPKIKGHPSTNGDVNIGNDVWIGHGTTIMSGLSIGNGAVIAANSTIVKNVGDYEVVGGNPAKKIKNRFDDKIIRKLVELKWWDLEISQVKEIIPFLCSSASEATVDELTRRLRTGSCTVNTI